MINKAIEMINKQQKGKEETAVYCVGEQLKDIIRNNPEAAEIVAQDLKVKEMSLAQCEKEIKAFADERHKKNGGNGACVMPHEAERIIRAFYGLPDGVTEECSRAKETEQSFDFDFGDLFE